MLPKQHSRCCCRCQLVFQHQLEQLLRVCIPHKTTYNMAAPDGRSRGCKVSCRDRWHLSTWSWLGRQGDGKALDRAAAVGSRMQCPAQPAQGGADLVKWLIMMCRQARQLAPESVCPQAHPEARLLPHVLAVLCAALHSTQPPHAAFLPIHLPGR